MSKVIGMDLGTTNSVVAYYETKSPEVILTSEGDRLLPSVVAFLKEEEILIGNAAKGQLIINPTNAVFSVKRLMGKQYSEFEPYLDQFPYQIIKGEEDSIRISINNKLFSPEEISAMIINKMKESAEEYLNDKVDAAVITVPAYFNDSQRQSTKVAGEIAGLNVLRIINEPTAASLAYNLDLKKQSKIIVYDFGGGTFDISLLEIDNEIIKVIATSGDSNLGGNDLDITLANSLIKEIEKKYDINLSKNKLAIQRLRDASENAKKELSYVEECEINLPFIADSSNGPVHFLKYLTRNEFENLISEKIAKTIKICESLLKGAKVEVEEIEELILVGGTTRMPIVQRKINEFFKKEPNKKINPDEIVAMGAAIQGAMVSGKSKDILLLDVIPLSLGVKTFGGTFTRVIEANTTIPTNQSLVFSTAEDNQSEVEIIIFQGEREIAEENKLLGKFTLTRIKPALKGMPRIEVTFNININGILTVSAINLSTKEKKEIIVSQSGLLRKKDIERIKKDAEKYKKSDMKRKEFIEQKNQILNYVYSIEKILHTFKVEETIKADGFSLITKARSEVKKENPTSLKKLEKQLKELNTNLDSLTKEPKSKNK